MTKVKDKDKNDEKSQRQRHRKQLHEHTISSSRRINKHFTIQETRKVKYVISIFSNVHLSSAIAKHTLLHQIWFRTASFKHCSQKVPSSLDPGCVSAVSSRCKVLTQHLSPAQHLTSPGCKKSNYFAEKLCYEHLWAFMSILAPTRVRP